MIIVIIIIVVIVVASGYGLYRANNKITAFNKKKLVDVEQEFEDGKILLPIDKRDFEDFNSFKNKTSHIKIIDKKVKTIDKDFNDLEFKTHKNEDGRK